MILKPPFNHQSDLSSASRRSTGRPGPGPGPPATRTGPAQAGSPLARFVKASVGTVGVSRNVSRHMKGFVWVQLGIP